MCTVTLITAKCVILALYQVWGRLSQARNDKLHKTYVVMHIKGCLLKHSKS